MKKWSLRELEEAGYKIQNAEITAVDLLMADHGCLTDSIVFKGGGWGCVYGGFCIGKGYLGCPDDFFSGSPSGIEYLMRIMDTVGVDKFQRLKGKYVRVATKGFGSEIKIIGNILTDKWFDAESFFIDFEKHVASEFASSTGEKECTPIKLLHINNRYFDLQNFKKALQKRTLNVGDELVTTDIDGEAVYVVAHLKDGKAYMVRKWLLDNSEERPLISDEFNAFDWLNNEYRESLPEDIREMIVGAVTLPSAKEIFGENLYGLDEEGEQFEWFKNVTNRVAAYSPYDEYTRWWWTRSKTDKVSASYFAYVADYGAADSTTPSAAWGGLRPHVILKE